MSKKKKNKNNDIAPVKYEGNVIGNALKNALTGNNTSRGNIWGAILGSPLGNVFGNVIDESEKKREIEAPIKQEQKEQKSKKIIQSAKDTSDDSYNKLIEYKKEKGINLLNEGKFKNDKTYQSLLKQAQNDIINKQQTEAEEKTKNYQFEKGLVGGLEKGSYALANGFERGVQGTESVALKILGQTPETPKTTMLESMSNKASEETKSKVGRAGLDIAGSIGQMLPQMMVGNPTGAMTLGFANYGGSAYNEAKKDGASEKQATMYGIVSGSTEMLMEKVLGGFENIYGKKMGKSFTDNVMNKLVKNKVVRQTLSGMKGEFTEEYLQQFLEPILKNIILEENNGADFWNTMKDDIGKGLKQLSKQFFNSENLQAGLEGAMTSGIMEAPRNISINSQGFDVETGRTKNSQSVFDNEVNERIKEAEKDGKKLSNKEKTKIEQEVKEDLENGQIGIDRIESSLGGETYNKYKELQDKISSLKEEQTNLKNKSMQEATLGDSERLKQIETEISQIDDSSLKQQLSDEVRELTKDDELLQRSYTERDNRSKEFVYEGTDSDTDITKATIESTKGKLNNTKKSHNLVDALIKMGNDRGVSYKVTNTEELKQMGLAKDGKTTNGVYVVDNGEIYVNLDSKNYLEQILVHETTHTLGNAKVYEDLQRLSKEFSEKNGTYEKVRQEIENNYDEKDWDSETTARILEDNLGNEDFIKELTNQKPSVVQKIINTIKYLKKQFSTSSVEARKLNKIQYQMEQAYKKAYNEKSDVKNNGDNKYSFAGEVALENIIDDKETYKSLKKLKELAEKKLSSGEMTNEDIRRKYKWFQDKNGQWKFEFTNKYTNISDKIKSNSDYKLSDIIDDDVLFKLYPDLTNVNVYMRNMGLPGGKTATNDIYINNDLLKDKINLKRTLLHEIQHIIQNYEGFENGKSVSKDGIEAYINSLGEIEAIEVERRMNYDNETLNLITPENSTSNPRNPYKNFILEKYNNSVYNNNHETNKNIRENKMDIIQEEDARKNQETTDMRRSVDSERIGTNGKKELDNSSFSNEKNTNIAPVKGEVRYSLNESEKTELDGLKALDESGLANKEELNRIKELEKKQKVPERIEKARKNYVENKVEKAIRKQAYKNINIATKTVQNYLEFNNTEKKVFKDSLIDLSTKTKEELVNANSYNEVKDIINQFANKEYNYVDSELKDLKKQIKNTKINIPEEVRNQITDYSDFRKESKLNISKQGQNIDSVWQQLSETYPYYFSNDISTETDMLNALSEFMNKDIKTTEKFKIPDSELKIATDKVYNKLLQNSLTQADISSLEQDIEVKAERRTRQVVQNELLNKMGLSIEDLSVGKDISSVEYQRTDPKRLHEKVFGYEIGKKINDATVNFANSQEAKSNRWKNAEREDIKELGIKARSKESAAVQKYGEKQWVKDNGEVLKYGDAELEQEFSNPKTREKIKHASEVIRQKYDNYIDKINESIVEMGYDPIPKRKDYFRHFYELQDKFSQWGIPFNKNDMNSDVLPTDINGLTDEFKPGKNWFASAMERTGMKTTYDAITGIDGYLESASNLIFHTETIQRYRALSKFIRENYGAEHGLENIDGLSDEQIQQRISDIQNNKLSKYVAWLDEQANALAGKKDKGLDRAMERFFGRKVFSALNTLKSQVGSNMTGFNVRSAMTNFASAIQGASKTNKIAFIKGTLSTLNNMISDDGLINKSDFLTNRFGSDSLSKKMWQKVANAGQIFMTGTDYFTSNQIWRSKYYENLSKGMSETEAIKNADDFSARIMGDRSKGQTAEIFNSKTLGFLTQFQLEVNNQWSSMIHDNKMDIKSGNKSGAMVVFQLGQLYAMSYGFNVMMKALTGSDVMFDPIDILKDILKPDDDDETLEEKTEKIFDKLLANIPMGSLFGKDNGRIPIQEALPIKQLVYGIDTKGYKKNRKDIFLETLPYWLMPTGYGQLRKTTKGLSMYDDKLPIKGSYTKSGNLRFSADDTMQEKIKASLFGQYATKNAKDYIDSGYKSIDKRKLDEMKDLDMNSTEYRKYRKGLSEAGTKKSDKLDYINSLDISNKKKNIMASNVMQKDINMKDYNKYNSYEEFDYAYKNPDKYKMITTITDYNTYQDISKYIKEIKADVDRNGNTISGSRLKKVANYVNSLNLSAVQKAMIIKQEYPSFTQYDKQIAQYINKQNLSFVDKAKMLKGLGFKSYDNQIINYVKNNYKTIDEQIKALEDMGFKTYTYNGKTYVKR